MGEDLREILKQKKHEVLGTHDSPHGPPLIDPVFLNEAGLNTTTTTTATFVPFKKTIVNAHGEQVPNTSRTVLEFWHPESKVKNSTEMRDKKPHVVARGACDVVRHRSFSV